MNKHWNFQKWIEKQGSCGKQKERKPEKYNKKRDDRLTTSHYSPAPSAGACNPKKKEKKKRTRPYGDDHKPVSREPARVSHKTSLSRFYGAKVRAERQGAHSGSAASIGRFAPRRRSDVPPFRFAHQKKFQLPKRSTKKTNNQETQILQSKPRVKTEKST